MVQAAADQSSNAALALGVRVPQVLPRVAQDPGLTAESTEILRHSALAAENSGIDICACKRLRAARLAAGLTQQQLADASGVRQPNISAIERGLIDPREETVQRLERAMRRRPSSQLRRHRDEVVRIVERHHAKNPRVFGSIARHEDTVNSDLDLLVDFDDDATLLDLVRMADEIEELLGVRVDIVDDHTDRRILARAHSEAVPL